MSVVIWAIIPMKWHFQQMEHHHTAHTIRVYDHISRQGIHLLVYFISHRITIIIQRTRIIMGRAVTSILVVIIMPMHPVTATVVCTCNVLACDAHRHPDYIYPPDIHNSCLSLVII